MSATSAETRALCNRLRQARVHGLTSRAIRHRLAPHLSRKQLAHLLRHIDGLDREVNR